MRISIVSLFPGMFESVFNDSIIKRAMDSNLVTIDYYNFRDYSLDPHKKVDDTPFGGGAGMLLMCQPIIDCINDIKTDDSLVVLLTPSGIPFKESIAYDLSKVKHLILICGHYEGFDERVKSVVDMELSIGDYVLTGGEIPAMVIVDAVTRLIPGVINEESHLNDSFSDPLVLDYPNYTKPRDFRGMLVPEVLLSGDHKKIDEWRKSQADLKTREVRPDLKS
ncbi:MAG: tRNA (guanosine(37)-N1)-methyltransferase TrmD [Bacilli bacterium]|nr:tRNA (guanosine(37)-N1)-methyltransferase TrmD [Bacilli bacterium]